MALELKLLPALVLHWWGLLSLYNTYISGEMPQGWAEVGCPLWLDAAEWLLTNGAAETVCKELTE